MALALCMFAPTAQADALDGLNPRQHESIDLASDNGQLPHASAVNDNPDQRNLAVFIKAQCDISDGLHCVIGVCSPHFRDENPWIGTWGHGGATGVYVGGVGPTKPGIKGTGLDTGNWYAGYGC